MTQPSPKSTGSRPVCDACRAAETVADAFEGLPQGATRWTVMGLLRQASAHFSLSARELGFLEELVAATYDIDWTPGCEPIVYAPVYELAERLGVTERQIRNIERGLVEKRLLCWRDSGNHARKGRRDAAGRIVYAYGVSLAPLGARAAEIRLAARQAQQEISERRQARSRIQALRRRARQLGRLVPPAAERIPAGMALAAMRRVIDALSAELGAAEDPQAPADISARAETPAPIMTPRTVQKTASGPCDPPIDPGEAAAPRGPTTTTRLADLLLRAGGPRAGFYCAASPTRSLRDIAERCAEIARELAIPQPRWIEAVETLGLEPAVALLCLIDRRSPTPGASVERPILCPAGFLTHHLRRKRSGERVRPRPFGAMQAMTAVAQPAVSPSRRPMGSHHARP